MEHLLGPICSRAGGSRRPRSRPNGNAAGAIPEADSPADSLTAHELLTILDEELSPLRRIDDFGGLEPQETRPEAIQAGQDG